MRRCSRCVMPETWQGITFDENRVCSLCREYEKQEKINWVSRKNELSKVVSYYKNYARENGVKYEVIVGFSGGKDSTYTLWIAVKELHLRVLVVTFDHGFHLTPEGEWNLSQIPKMLDCDHIRFAIGNGLRNALCRKGSELIGDFCIHCHRGVGTTAARISQTWNVPFQLWGEPTSTYSTTGDYKFEDLEEQDYEHFEKVFSSGTTIETLTSESYEPIDLQPLTWPKGKFPLKAIYLGHYEKGWNQKEHARIIKQELGWKPYRYKDFDPELIRTWGNYRNWDKVDCPFETIRNWQKFLRRGFDKISFQCSKDIRDGLMTREQGLEMLKYEGQKPVNFDQFTEQTGISEQEIERITKRLCPL